MLASSVVLLCVCYGNAIRLTKRDVNSEKRWQQNNYDPKTATDDLTYTSQRVAVMMYNTYASNLTNKQHDYEVFGYYSDWSQYDGRLDDPDTPNAQCGRGVDMKNFYNTNSFDRFIFSFFGIVGDRGSKSETVAAAAKHLDKKDNECVPLDPWGDLASYRNVGFLNYKHENYVILYNEKEAQGALGGMIRIKKNNAKRATTLSYSVGGWTLSQPFHYFTQSNDSIDNFVASIVDFHRRFPSFSQIDIDWEYPNGQGAEGTDYGAEDSGNFAKLLSSLKLAMPNLTISVAVSADPDKMFDGEPDKYEPYVDFFNVMTYDFAGAFSVDLGHHTNLREGYLNNGLSVEKAVDMLLNLNIPAKKINIGFTSYSRNLKNVEIDTFDPLDGTISGPQTPALGTFESNVLEWYDVMANYLHFDGKKLYGKNGYCLYHDSTSDADYLYSNTTKIFISLDTPRSVYAKAQYVKENNLHGMFEWMIDYDNGLLANAAHEGFDHKILRKKIDMAPLLTKPSPEGDCWVE
ncbi:chitinase [Phenacoccus solenopsis nudivirus]|nr:chitinase [Phenacoccus solenopsis nudivirus]